MIKVVLKESLGYNKHLLLINIFVYNAAINKFN